MGSLARFSLSRDGRDSIAGGKKARKHSKAFLAEERWGFLFVIIPLIGFGLFVCYPSIRSFFLSFTNYREFMRLGEEVRFVGFDNYVTIFNRPLFWNSVLNTIVLLVSIPIGISIGLLVATYINRAAHGSRILSLVYYLPAVTSAVVISVVWNFIFNIENGIVNSALGIQGFNWFNKKDFFVVKIAILIKGVWGGIGGTMLLFLAGLKNVPLEYYEASKIDGASGLQQFVHITMPMVHPTTFYLIVTGVIGHLQSYADAKFFATAAGDQASTIVYYMWNTLYPAGDYNLIGAVGTVFALVVIAITVFQFNRSDMFDI